MDGPVIQEAADISLKAGTNAADVFAALKVAASTGVAAVVMTYWNPIEKYGVEKFAKSIADNGGSGVITPDLTIEESEGLLAATSKAQINPIYVVAPSTKDARLAEVTAKSGGFVYAASLMGVTGTRNSVSTGAADLVARVRTVTELPISVGLGVSTREQAKSLAAYADGVIVGSAFIKLLLEAKSEQEIAEYKEQIAESKEHAEQFAVVLAKAEKRFAALAKIEKRHAEAYQSKLEAL
jgi:tryptophan synthase alpha chain